MRLSHWALLIAVNLAFGLNLVATKFAVAAVPPLAFAAMRFALVLLVLAPFLRWHRGQMMVLFVVGFLMGTLHFAFITMGLALADDVSTVAILAQLGVPFATLMSVVFLKEEIQWRRWLGISMAFIGVMIIGFDPRVFNYVEAVILVTLAAAVAAGGLTLMKSRVRVNAFQLQGWLAVVACPTLALLSLAFESGQADAVTSMNAIVIGSLVFSALGASLLGHGGTFVLLRHYDLSLISPLLLLSTVFGIAGGVLILDDVVTQRMWLGGTVTIAGVLLITLRNRNRIAVSPLDQPAVLKPRPE